MGAPSGGERRDGAMRQARRRLRIRRADSYCYTLGTYLRQKARGLVATVVEANGSADRRSVL